MAQRKTFPQDKSKLVASEYQQIKSGVNPAKCLALIRAAVDGDLSEVLSLATDSEVDINFMADIFENRNRYHYSAICAAVVNNRHDVVLALLKSGARVEISHSEQPGCNYHSYFITYNLLDLIVNLNKDNIEVDLALVKTILRASTAKNLGASFGPNFLSFLHLMLGESRYQGRNKEEWSNLFFHEAVLKGQRKIIEDAFSRGYTPRITFTVTSFQDYIKDITFTSKEVSQAYEMLDYLVEKQFIGQETCEQMKGLFGKQSEEKPAREKIEELQNQVMRLFQDLQQTQPPAPRPQTQRDEPYPSSTPSLSAGRGGKH